MYSLINIKMNIHCFVLYIDVIMPKFTSDAFAILISTIYWRSFIAWQLLTRSLMFVHTHT